MRLLGILDGKPGQDVVFITSANYRSQAGRMLRQGALAMRVFTYVPLVALVTQVALVPDAKADACEAEESRGRWELPGPPRRNRPLDLSDPEMVYRLITLKKEIEVLKLQCSEYELATPIVFMGVGSGFATVGLWLFAWSGAWTDDPHPDNTVPWTWTLAGGTVAALGGILLFRRIGTRNALGRQIKEQHARLRRIEKTLEFTPMVSSNTQGLQLSLRF